MEIHIGGIFAVLSEPVTRPDSMALIDLNYKGKEIYRIGKKKDFLATFGLIKNKIDSG